MTTTKNITKAIYCVGLFTAIFLDISHLQFYYGIILIAIQTVFILSEYVKTNRIIPNEIHLVKKNSPFTLKDLFLVIPLMVLFFWGFNLLFKWFTIKYLVIYTSVAVLSAVIQFFIIKNKNIATLVINKSELIINELFIKSYNLETLCEMTFDGFNDVYIARFTDSQKIKIKKDDYRQDDLNKFIEVMVSKSSLNVLLSDNIKNEITVANKNIEGNGA